MKISIISRKEGTGKTFFATNLALSMINVQFIDCNVENPNSNQILNIDIDKKEDVEIKIPDIDRIKCNFCKKCVEICRYNAIYIEQPNIIVFPNNCQMCRGCELICPKDAIEYKDKKIGTIEYGKKAKIDFLQGLLEIGETHTSDMIKYIIKKIDLKKDVIIDTPSGSLISLNEIIKATDYSIIITEPTPSGFQNLKQTINIITNLKKPFGVVINKEGIGDKHIETYLTHEKISILMKIPYDKEIYKLNSQGKTIINKIPKYRQDFTNIFEKIRRGLRSETARDYQW